MVLDKSKAMAQSVTAFSVQSAPLGMRICMDALNNRGYGSHGASV